MILRPDVTKELRDLAQRMGDTLSAGAAFTLSSEDYRLIIGVIEALEAHAETRRTQMNDAFTICTKCKHFHNVYPRSPRAHIWYNQYCRAEELPRAQDPVDGKLRHFKTNDLGMTVFVDLPWQHCRTANPHGECEHFAKENTNV